MRDGPDPLDVEAWTEWWVRERLPVVSSGVRRAPAMCRRVSEMEEEANAMKSARSSMQECFTAEREKALRLEELLKEERKSHQQTRREIERLKDKIRRIVSP